MSYNSIDVCFGDLCNRPAELYCNVGSWPNSFQVAKCPYSAAFCKVKTPF